MLVRAFQHLVDRHESLRTSFSFINGQVVQYVHPTLKVIVDIVEASEEELMEYVHGFTTPFNLEQPPLFKVKVIKIRKISIYC